MAKWRALNDYSPFARLLVEYMWEQRPPLAAESVRPTDGGTQATGFQLAQ